MSAPSRGNGAAAPEPEPAGGPVDPGVVARQPAVRVVVALLLAYLFVGGPLQLVNVSFGLAFGEVFLFALPALLLVRAANFAPAPFLRLGRPKAATLALAALVGAANFPLAGGLAALALRLWPRLAERFDQRAIFEGLTSSEMAMIAVSVVLVAPVCEEILFRGYVQRVLEARRPGAPAVIAAAGLFALMHLDPLRFVVFLELGCLMGFLALRTGSVWSSVAAHVANNLASTLAYLAFGRDGAEAAPAQLAEALALGAGATAVALALLVRHARTLPREEPIAAAEPGAPHPLSLRRIARPALGPAAAAAAALVLFGVVYRPAFAAAAADLRYPVDVDRRVAAQEDRRAIRRRLREIRRRADRGAMDAAAYAAMRRALGGPGPLTPADVERTMAAAVVPSPRTPSRVDAVRAPAPDLAPDGGTAAP